MSPSSLQGWPFFMEGHCERAGCRAESISAHKKGRRQQPHRMVRSKAVPFPKTKPNKTAQRSLSWKCCLGNQFFWQLGKKKGRKCNDRKSSEIFPPRNNLSKISSAGTSKSNYTSLVTIIY